MATIGVLTYILPDGLKLNKNFINKTLNQSSSSSTSNEKRVNYNTINNKNNNKPNKIINLTNIESLGMIGSDVIVMRTKQKLTPLKEPHHNIENFSSESSIKQPPNKKQKLTAAIKNVSVTTMPLTDIINTTNVTSSKLSLNVTSGLTSVTSNSITVPLNNNTLSNSIKPENNSIPNHLPDNATLQKKELDNEKFIVATKICGTNTKTNQPITTGGRKSTPLPQAVARRNARERNRVKQVNNGFAALRQRIPDEVAEAFEASGGRGTNKKLSKVETLRMAVEYIRSLERILGFEYPAHMTSPSQSDSILSPLPSDDDILFNSTSDFVTNMSVPSPQPLQSPVPQQQQQQHLNLIKKENSVIKTENSNTPSPIHQNSPEDRLGSSFDDANSSLYDHEEGTIYYTANLPDITTINGQDYLRIPGTNTYQLITPEMLENEENIHPTGVGVLNQKTLLNAKNTFVDINELINASDVQQNELQLQLPLPSMPFTTSMLDQQRSLQISQFSSSSDHQTHHSPQNNHNHHHHHHEPQSISPLTINCISENAPALIPSPDQFSSHSSNMSGSSYATNTTAGHHNNNNFTTLIDQHLSEQQQSQLQNEGSLLTQLQHLHNHHEQQQRCHQHDHQMHPQSHQLLKVKIEPQQHQQQQQQYQTMQIINGQLPTNTIPLGGGHDDFGGNHDFSRTIGTTAVVSNETNSHIYETIDNVINQSRCDENNSRNSSDESHKIYQKIKIERNVILDTANLNEENMMDAIEWWEANTPKSDEC